MTDISPLQLRRLDMTLLLVFQELMRHRNLTKVAARLGLTQSAISHALRRLRELFGDELFLRRPAGVEPTARALALEPRIAAIVDLSRELVSGEDRFDPKTDARTLRLRMLDFESVLLAGPLTAHLRRAAPNWRLSIRSLPRRESLELMARGELDIGVGFYPGLDESFRSRTLFEEDYAVVARKRHQAAAKPLTLERYTSLDHMLVSFDGELRGIVDQALERLGKTRRVVTALPYFLPALAAVAKSDLIATVPRRLAELQAARFGLEVLKAPIAIRSFAVSAVYHRRLDRDAGLIWFLRELEDMTRRLLERTT